MTAEDEAKRMAAVLSASYPKGWRFRTLYQRGLHGFRASAGIERFDGAYWECRASVSGGWMGSKDAAYRSMLGAWAEKARWTEDVGTALRPASLPFPPAASTEELCLKLEVAEAAG